MQDWQKRMNRQVAKLTPAQARDYLARIRQAGITINQPAIRELTNGLASQTINFIVVRKLAARAGMIAKGAG